MTITDSATDIAMPSSEDSQDDAMELAPQRAANGASKPLRSLLLGFAATVTIGLALASWYVGVRIVDADEVAPASATAPVPANSPPVAIPSTPPTANNDALAEAYWSTVPSADVYLQVAGIGPKQDAGFVKSLATKGFRAQLQGGDRADNARILIGPFATHAEMEQAQRKLQSAGVLAVESAH
jgi:cell division septation protein DedD